jgi:NAD(P)-dependent dehydrogenase (short-subunit alcohol dehydrogenase family)
MKRLNGKVILVTGASSGIGRTTTLKLARAGASVIAADLNVDGGEALVDEIRTEGHQAVFLRTDVTDATQVQAAVQQGVKRHGRLDGAFNNAGILEGTFLHAADIDECTWDRVIDVNLRAVWLCMKAQIPVMLSQGHGSIVNHASIAGLYGNRIVGAAYIASKHGVVGLTRAAALEYADRGLRINAICPGIIDNTPMSEAIFGPAGEREDAVKALYPIRRVGELGEVAEVVTWLFSDAPAFMTGHALPLDGGLLAQ